MAHQLAPCRDAAGDGEDEAAERIDVLLLLARDELDPKLLLQILDRHPRIGDQPEARIGADQRLVLHVMLVGDLADHLFDQILDGDEPVSAAIFVDHEREVEPRRLHLEQEIEHRHRVRHVKELPRDIHGAHGALEVDFAEIESSRSARFRLRRDPRHQIADVDHAARIVERFVIERQARMLRLAEHAHQLVNGHIIVDRDDVGARHHHVLDGKLAEAEDAAQHAALLRAQGIALAAGKSVLDQLAQVRLLAETERGEQALEPGYLLVGLAGLLGRNVVFGDGGVAHDDASAGSASSA